MLQAQVLIKLKCCMRVWGEAFVYIIIDIIAFFGMNIILNSSG